MARTITALKRPKGWRKGAGHRTSVLEARGAADDYWSRGLEGAALRPDITRLAQESIKADRASKEGGAQKRPSQTRVHTHPPSY